MRAVCLTLTVATVLAASPAWPGPNLLVNAGFEASAPGEEDFGWHLRRGAGAEVVEITVDAEVGYEGAASVRISQKAPVYSAISQIFETRPNTIYATEVWVRGEDILSVGRGPRVFIGDERGRHVAADRLQDYWAGTGWHRLKCVFNSLERLEMCIVPMIHNATGTAWFSRPSVREVTPEAAEISGRHHGWSYMLPQPETGFAYFGRDVAHICPQFPSVVWFTPKMSFSDPEQSNPRVVFELPEGVTVAGGYRQWQRTIEETRTGTRCELSGSTTDYCPLYLATTWQPGRRGEARLWVEWEGGRQQEPFIVPLECIEMPRARRPERLVAGLSGPPIGLYPGDFVAYASHLGFNTVNLWSSAGWVDPPSEDFVAIVDAYREAGFWVSDNYSPLRYKYYLELLAENEDMQACGIDGKRVPHTPCPSYRGEAYLTEGRRIANMAASGISYAHLDEEVWNGHGICFCERCLSRWAEYRKERYPDLADTSPRAFESNPAQHLALHEAWVRFKCQLVTEMFAGWRKMLFDKVREKGASSSPQPWFDAWLAVSPQLADMYYFLHDPEGLPEGLDHLVPMIYAPASVVREELVALVPAAGREHLLAGLTAGEPTRGRQIFPPSESRAQVLEAIFAPTMGYVLWTYHRSDAGTLAELARTNDLMARIEDTLLDGKPSRRISVVAGDAHLTAYELGDEIITFVRDYEDPGKVTLEVAGRATWQVTDAYTAKDLARISADQREIVLDLAQDNARVLKLVRVQAG